MSEPSELERAALPRCTTEFHDDRTPDKILIEIEEKKRLRKALAKKCNVRLEDLDVMILDGRIKICRCCQEPARHHKKGDGVQHVCVKCRKKELKK